MSAEKICTPTLSAYSCASRSTRMSKARITAYLHRWDALGPDHTVAERRRGWLYYGMLMFTLQTAHRGRLCSCSLHQRHCGHHSGRHERSKQNRVDIWQDWPKPSWLAWITKGKVCLHSWTVVQPSSIIILQRTKDYCPGDDLNSQKRKNRSAILAASCKQCERCTMFVISPPHCSSLTSFCHTVTTGSAKASQSWSHSIGMHADSRAPTPSYAPASQTPSSHLACAQDQYSLQSTAVRGGAAKGWTQTTAGAATMLPLSSYRYLGLVQKLY